MNGVFAMSLWSHLYAAGSRVLLCSRECEEKPLIQSQRRPEAELARVGHDLQPDDTVVLNTQAGSWRGAAESVTATCRLGRKTALYLVKRGMTGFGANRWNEVAPLSGQTTGIADARDYGLSGGNAVAKTVYCHIEQIWVEAVGFDSAGDEFQGA